MAGSRRPFKLPYRELYISCPHCKSPLVIGTVMETLNSHRTCPKCAKELLIENDVVRKPDSRKPSRSVEATKSKRKSG